MEKLILADNTELEIRPGASLGAITAEVEDFAALQPVHNTITKEGNLDTVKFKSGENVTGEYSDMKLESPVFRSVDVVDGKVRATFCPGENRNGKSNRRDPCSAGYAGRSDHGSGRNDGR